NHTTFYHFALTYFIARCVNLTDLVTSQVLRVGRAFFYRDRAIRVNRHRTFRMVVRGLVFNHHVLARDNRFTAQLIVVRYLWCILRFRRIVRGTVVFLRNQWVLHNDTTFYPFTLTSFIARCVNLTDLVAERIFATWRAFFYRDRAIRVNRLRAFPTVVRDPLSLHDALPIYNRFTAQLIVVRYLWCILRFRRIVRSTVVFLRNQWVLHNY